MPWLHFFSTAAWLAAAGGLYLFLLNRALIPMRSSSYKAPISGLVLLVLVVGAGSAGWISGYSAWLAVPGTFFGLLVVGEVYRLLLRWLYRADAPLEVDGPQLNLRQPVTTTHLRIAHYRVKIPGWRGGRLRVVHLTDFHVNEHYPAAYYEQVVRRANAMTPDLVFLTGDFVSHEQASPRLPGLLRPLQARLGVYAVLGNHDYWAGGPTVAEAVENAGITLLGDSARRLESEQGVVWVCGYEEPWGAGGLQAPRRDGGLRLVLTHTPDNVYDLARLGFHAIFAGHFHAGQFRIPWIGSIVVPSVFGRRFDHGHFKVHGAHLFVSAGVGAGNPPLRLYCPPDFFVIEVVGNLH